MARPSLALYWAGSCGGCEIAVLELHERILELVQNVDIVFWPCVMDPKYDDVRAMADDSVDLCLFNGTIETTENLAMARLLRRKAKRLVAFGACASMGGVPGLRNAYRRDEVLEVSFRTSATTDPVGAGPPLARTERPSGAVVELPRLFERARSLGQVVTVDHVVPGCPPEADTVAAATAALLAAPPVGAPLVESGRSVCDECPLERRGQRIRAFTRPHQVIPEPGHCLLEQGLLCIGPATAAGCRARCPSVRMPCRGCYGPPAGVASQGDRMVGFLGSLVEGSTQSEVEAVVAGVVDPVGTLHRFGLPTSLLGRSRR